VAVHELPLDAANLHGYYSRELEPVAAIEPGDSVRIAVPNAGWDLSAAEKFPPRNPDLDAGHPIAGPIAVTGAKAGDTLVVRVDSVEVGEWGVTWAPPDHLVHWQLADGVGRALGFECDLAPFLGVMGMPPPEAGVHPTFPPRSWGGNIDCKELVAGSMLYLPIPVDGALFSAGDPHGAQGDGEVSSTAIETTAEAQLTLDVRNDLPLQWPIARVEGAWLTFGFDEDLDEAAKIATEGMIRLMSRELGLGERDALALASVVVDLRVTQIVNGVQGVHAVLSDDAIRSE
jgi:acetamidase/formamidase